MKRSTASPLGWTIAALTLTAQAAIGQPTTHADNPDAARTLADARAQQPLGFEPNVGQAAPDAVFIARATGYQATVMKDGSMVHCVSGHAGSSRMTLLGAHPQRWSPENRLQATTRYAMEGASTHEGVPNFERVTFSDVYPGVDAVYHSRQGAVEYDFDVAPGADAQAIRLAFPDAKRVDVDARSGELLVTDQDGVVARHSRPEVYQEDVEHRDIVPGSYRKLGQRTVAFEIGAYDHARRLIIDPTINVTRFLKGNNDEHAFALTVDSFGNTFIAGVTTSTNGFPYGNTDKVAMSGKNCTLQKLSYSGYACANSAFVVKLDPSGNIMATVLFGGSGYTSANSLAVDDSYLYVAGGTNSSIVTGAGGQYPAVGYVYGVTPPTGTMRAYLAKFSPQLTKLEEVTTLAANGRTEALGVAVNASSPYLTGSTCGAGFPTTKGAYKTTWQGACDAFVTKLDYLGTMTGTFGAVYSTYLGGSANDQGNAIAVNVYGMAWVTGQTCSSNFTDNTGLSHGSPGIKGYYGAAGCNAFVTEMIESGAFPLYSIYLGGSYYNDPLGNVWDEGTSIVLDGTNGAYVGGYTSSRSFYTVQAPGHPPLQSAIPCDGCYSGFVSYVNAGFITQYSTFLGGTTSSSVTSVAKNSRGDVYVGGAITASSGGFPGTTTSTFNPSGGYVAKLSSTLDSLSWTQLLGAEVNGVVARNVGTGAAAVLNTTVWTTGDRKATSTTTGDGGWDAFMVKLTDPTVITLPPTPPICRVCVVR